ncbi:MAG: Transcriptional regulator, ArsR family [Hydrocarboniphaga sp.]|uniref:ArsR/SmtB family transcription factor n=1 Tax=Hydrocarboniphaga sp. TaxID=2033016 RepID=UPI0026217DB6|nr:metalloregulator ArsR/SmtB family transcription factor [Hydrocarboniphaga sp.]MDB5967792.1 Transcriptional regulator, ArsR family [Hydrocarboniphaga sp.]
MPQKSAAPGRLYDNAAVFAALGDATRLRLVARLCENGPQSIVRLTEGGEVSRQAVTKHLRALEHAGLVRSGRSGRERLWEVRTQRLAEARRCLDQISEQWDHALERLRSLVEADSR